MVLRTLKQADHKVVFKKRQSAGKNRREGDHGFGLRCYEAGFQWMLVRGVVLSHATLANPAVVNLAP
jgi:hypothetical protein